MMLRTALITALAALSVTSARASDAGKKGDVGQYVDLQPVALPVVANGKLVNYVFVNVRINLTNSANAARLREKEPYFRDALVRASHRTPFNKANDLNQIDGPRLMASLTREAAAIVGPGQIRSFILTSQAPRRRLGPTNR